MRMFVCPEVSNLASLGVVPLLQSEVVYLFRPGSGGSSWLLLLGRGDIGVTGERVVRGWIERGEGRSDLLNVNDS